MATLNYLLNFNDVTKTGLTLTFTAFNDVTTNTPIAPPAIFELGNGFYKYGFDIDGVSDDVYYVVSDGLNVLTGTINLVSPSSLKALSLRQLGLAQENQAIDNTVFDGNGNLLSARLRTYTLAGSVGTDNDVLSTYTISSSYVGTQLDSYGVVKL